MNERSSAGLAFAVLVLTVLACKNAERRVPTTTSASASGTVEATKPWLDVARTAWPEAKIERITNDAGAYGVDVTLTSKAPKPAEIAERVRDILAIEGLDAPCAIQLTVQDEAKNDAGRSEPFFIGHLVRESTVAYKSLTPVGTAKLMIERDSGDAEKAFQCQTPTWFTFGFRKHFLRDWRVYAREYSNVWDGSEKNPLQAEKMCERAVDLETVRGETFPDARDAIGSGVRFPQMSSQTIKWRSYTEYKSTKYWFTCEINANEAPTITRETTND